jgi:hypothetical protein
MHLVRLMRMADEILRTGKVLVKRPDAKDLIDIRNGAWDYDRLIAWADATEAQLNTIESPLPKEPNRNAIDNLLVETVDRYLHSNP